MDKRETIIEKARVGGVANRKPVRVTFLSGSLCPATSSLCSCRCATSPSLSPLTELWSHSRLHIWMHPITCDITPCSTLYALLMAREISPDLDSGGIIIPSLSGNLPVGTGFLWRREVAKILSRLLALDLFLWFSSFPFHPEIEAER